MPTPTWHNLAPQRRDRVLAAATIEFGRNGYSGGSLNVIAREAGVAKGSLFQYFDDKLDFFSYVAEQTGLRIASDLGAWLAGPSQGQGFLDYVTDALSAWVQYFADHPGARGITAATNLEMDPAIRAAVLAPVHRLCTEALRPLLVRAVAAGHLRSDADVEAVLALLLILLPHLALLPAEPGLNPLLSLHEPSTADHKTALRRLATPIFASFVTAESQEASCR